MSRWRASWPTHQVPLVQLAWVSGLVEGEGCFTRTSSTAHPTSTTGKKYPKVIFQLNMTDEDVVKEAAAVMGVGTVHDHKPGPRSVKMQWRWSVSAQAEVAWLMIQLYPMLGQRRSAKIDELWREIPSWAKKYELPTS